jgi:LPS sulfotransferase NodH
MLLRKTPLYIMTEYNDKNNLKEWKKYGIVYMGSQWKRQLPFLQTYHCARSSPLIWEAIVQPHTSYLICATPRSGTTLLCEALANTGIAGRPEEFFQARKETGLPRRPIEYFEGTDTAEIVAILGEDAGPNEQRMQPASGESYASYLARVIEEGTTPNGVFGAKVMWGYFEGLLSNLGRLPQCEGLAVSDLLPSVFPNLHYIWVTRRDKVGQAISLWRAIQTWTWRDEESSSPTGEASTKQLVFHLGAIDHLIQQIKADEASWEQYFKSNGIQPFTVSYEELAGAYEETARKILHYLDIPLPENLVFAPRRMKRQADIVSQEWVERYYQSLQQTI